MKASIIRSAKAILTIKSKLSFTKSLVIVKENYGKFPMTIKADTTEKTLHYKMLSVYERILIDNRNSVSRLIIGRGFVFYCPSLID